MYHAHYDSFRNLVTAIKEITDPKIMLHIYTSQLKADLEREKIIGPIVLHKHVNQRSVVHAQHKADILFLPLAFNSPIVEVIKTSAPGKMGEYLESGRPILVHAPADSFVSWYFKKYNCGIVVDQNKPKVLVKALLQILQDNDLRNTVMNNARVRAFVDFNLESARFKFQDLLKLKGNI